MAKDILLNMDNAELIEEYNKLGERISGNKDYKVTENDVFIVSTISKRKLIHKTNFKSGFPSRWG